MACISHLPVATVGNSYKPSRNCSGPIVSGISHRKPGSTDQCKSSLDIISWDHYSTNNKDMDKPKPNQISPEMNAVHKLWTILTDLYGLQLHEQVLYQWIGKQVFYLKKRTEKKSSQSQNMERVPTSLTSMLHK